MTVRSTMTIHEAAGVLGITGRASLNRIHARFHELVKEWHPDVSQHDSDLSHVTFIRIKEAYDILVEYGMNYELSFRAEDIRKGTEYDFREFWMSRFGDDPIWG
ncbi:MAG: J domain-containing protein [Methanoregula sp.]|nr:J domain-containing protein [Methanoregula sp.]